MPHRPQKPRKKAVDVGRRICYSVGDGSRESAENPAQGACEPVDFQGSPESESKRLHFDSTQLHWLWNETRRQLERYATRADEGVDLQAAMDFARWIQFSGLIRLFRDNPQSEPWKVDGELIDRLVRTLIMDCGEFLKLNTPGFVRVSQIEAVSHKLDLMASQLAKLSPPVFPETAEAGTAPPALQVISGGAL
jgi:hypothetical protein